MRSPLPVTWSSSVQPPRVSPKRVRVRPLPWAWKLTVAPTAWALSDTGGRGCRRWRSGPPAGCWRWRCPADGRVRWGSWCRGRTCRPLSITSEFVPGPRFDPEGIDEAPGGHVLDDEARLVAEDVPGLSGEGERAVLLQTQLWRVAGDDVEVGGRVRRPETDVAVLLDVEGVLPHPGLDGEDLIVGAARAGAGAAIGDREALEPAGAGESLAVSSQSRSGRRSRRRVVELDPQCRSPGAGSSSR